MREFRLPNPRTEDTIFYEDGTYQVYGWGHISYWQLEMRGNKPVLLYKHDCCRSWSDNFAGGDSDKEDTLAHAIMRWSIDEPFYDAVDSVLDPESDPK